MGEKTHKIAMVAEILLPVSSTCAKKWSSDGIGKMVQQRT